KRCGVLQLEGGILSAPLSGTGKILVETGAALAIVNGASKTLRGPVRNQGQTLVSGYVAFDTGADFTNIGTLELSDVAHVDCCFGTGTRRITNTVTGLVKGTGGTPNIEAPFDNQGTVSVESGFTYFANP